MSVTYERRVSTQKRFGFQPLNIFSFFSFQDLDRNGTVSAKEFLAFGKPYEPLKDLDEEGPVYGREVDLVAD